MRVGFIGIVIILLFAINNIYDRFKNITAYGLGGGAFTNAAWLIIVIVLYLAIDRYIFLVYSHYQNSGGYF